ncbi:MAG TPA: Uma2 family endonuclease [Thermoanaerobaculia bacterium]
MAVPMQKQLLTIEEFERAWDDGAYPPDARLELIRGEVVEMSPIGDPHFLSVMYLGDLLSDLKPAAISSLQGPLRLPLQESVPQPDAVVFRRRADFAQRPPRGKDALLVVEVSDSTLAYDRDVKMPLYAQAGVPEYWLVDLKNQRIFVYRQPSSEGYQEVRTYYRGETIAPKAFPGKRLGVIEILGP